MPYLVLRRAAIACALSLLVFSVSAEAHGWHRHLVRHHHGRVVHRAVHGHWRGGKRHRRFWHRRMAEGWGGLTSRPEGNGASPSVLVQIADRFVGLGNFLHARVAWCGLFAQHVAQIAGAAIPRGPALAINWLHAGTRLRQPQVGAWAVRNHHVALISGVLGHGLIQTVNGNYAGHVRKVVEPARRYIAFIAPTRG